VTAVEEEEEEEEQQQKKKKEEELVAVDSSFQTSNLSAFLFLFF
jgi:hypothetical protein